MYLYGASGHAKVIVEILEANGLNVLGLFDDNSGINSLIDLPVYNPLVHKDLMQDAKFIISVGNNVTRKSVVQRFALTYFNAIHPSSVLSNRIEMGIGNVIMPQVVVNTGSSIGNHVIINTSASVDHDCVLGDFVHISPNVALCGGVSVGEGTHIGAGSVVIPKVKIGKWCTIGAGSVIIKDVPDNCTVVGNPGRIIK